MHRVYRHRRLSLAGALALVGVAVYTLLLAGHLTSQFNAQLRAPDANALVGVFCLAEGQHVPDQDSPACPVCKGMASFQTALVPVELFLLPASFAAAKAQSYRDVQLTSAPNMAPRNRGPPTAA